MTRLEGFRNLGAIATLALAGAACGTTNNNYYGETPTPSSAAGASTPDNGATPGTSAAAGQSPDANASATPGANSAPVSCEKAVQLVWAPISIENKKTKKIVEYPQDFRVDGTENGSVTLVNFWDPNVTPGGTEEWMLFGDSGLNLSGIGADSNGNQPPTVEPRNIGFEGAGSDWRWNTQVSLGGCSAGEITREIADHLTRTESEGTKVVWTTPEELNAKFKGTAKSLPGDGVSR